MMENEGDVDGCEDAAYKAGGREMKKENQQQKVLHVAVHVGGARCTEKSVGREQKRQKAA